MSDTQSDSVHTGPCNLACAYYELPEDDTLVSKRGSSIINCQLIVHLLVHCTTKKTLTHINAVKLVVHLIILKSSVLV